MRRVVGAAVFVMVAGVVVAVVRALTEYDNLYGLIPLFDLDSDGSLPAVFSAGLLVAASLLTFANARAAHLDGTGLRRHWRFLSIAFLVMTVDELASLHEFLDRPVGELTGGGGLLTFAWVVPAAILVVGLLIAYVPFLLRLPRGIAARFVVAGGIYVGAAVGLDAITGWIVDSVGQDTLAYTIVSLCEEILELVGLLIFIDANLRHLGRRNAPLDFRVMVQSS